MTSMVVPSATPNTDSQFYYENSVAQGHDHVQPVTYGGPTQGGSCSNPALVG
jgi:hypothetical protein